MPNKVLIFVFILFGSSTFYAQELKLDSVYEHFENLNVKDGLSGGYVSFITFDENGYMWITTNHGLQRYDGFSIKSFGRQHDDEFNSPSEGFWNIHDDNLGHLWLRHGNEQHFVFEKSTEKFIPLKHDIMQFLFQDSLDNLWFIDNSYQICYIPLDELPSDITQIDRQWFQDNVVVMGATQLQNLNFRRQIELFPNHQIWSIVNSEFRIYDIDYENDTLYLKTSYKLDIKHDKELDKEYQLRAKFILDKFSNTVYLFYKSKYCILNIENGLHEECHPLPEGKSTHDPWLVTSNGDIWITSAGGLSILNPKKNTFTSFFRKDASKSSNFKLDGRRLKIDKEENVWITTNGFGIYKYSYLKHRFHYLGENNEGPVMAPMRNLGSTVLITLPKFFGSFDRENLNLIDILPNSLPGACSNRNYIIRHIEQDSLLDTSIKITCDDEDICYEYTLNRKGALITPLIKSKCIYPTIETVQRTHEKPIENHAHWTYSEKYSNNKINNNSELKLTVTHNLEYDSTGSVVNYETFDTSLIADSYRNPFLFTKTDFWFGFRNGALFRFNIANKKWTFYDDKPDGTGLSSMVVYNIIQDPVYPDSLLWIGTNQGINILDIKNGHVQYFNENNGLANNVINAILFDQRNNAWVSTNNGLAHIDYKTREVHTFYQDDGLQHNEFNVQVATKTDDGYFYFGGMGGLTYFHPETFYKDSIPSEVVITDYKIFNESVPFIRNANKEKGINVLKKPIDTKQTIEVNYHTKMISFTFSVLDFTAPQNNKYRYKLDGFNKKWIELGFRNEATFTNLNPGTYTLNVQGKNYRGVWSDINDSIKIKVLAPWWLTWWFKILVAGLLIGILYFIYRYRLNQKEKIQNLRNRISKDLHDEIGSTLSSIALFSIVAEKKIDPNQNEVRSVLNKINDKSTSVMESINDIVWTIGSGNESIKEIINRVRSFSSDLMKEDQRIVFEIEPVLKDKEVAMIVKRNIYMIMKEAINNAHKYANATLIKVAIEKVISGVKLTITDNGVGFNIDNTHSKSTLGGNGLRNIESRTEEIDGELRILSQPNQGTMIEVKFKLK